MKRLIVAVLVMVMLLSASIAFADSNRVLDHANLFTDAEKAEIQSAIDAFQKETGMDAVILTTKTAHSGTPEKVADDVYDKGGFGLDTEHSGFIYYIDLSERADHIGTTGIMIDYLTDERLEKCRTDSERYLSQGLYAKGVLTLIQDVNLYYKKGIPEGQYQYDILTGKQLTARHKALTTGELVVCALAALLVGFCTTRGVTGSYKLKGGTYSYDRENSADLHLAVDENTFIRTGVTRTRVPQNNNGRGGSSFGGHSGGSGVHISSSGTSHGGSTGHF